MPRLLTKLIGLFNILFIYSVCNTAIHSNMSSYNIFTKTLFQKFLIEHIPFIIIIIIIILIIIIIIIIIARLDNIQQQKTIYIHVCMYIYIYILYI